ncbi:MAG: DNA primase [Ignavibacteria bacterium]|nr:DNA primase [Ignavibacteria bacterium]
MRIPQEKLEEIAQANDIIDVISSYTPVKKRGKAFLALCPFHPDKHPSLNISQEKQVYHCFSCKASGNVYRFVQEYEKITFFEAAEKLAIRAGIELNLKQTSPDISNEISRLFEMNKITAKFFNNNLNNLNESEEDFIYGYLIKRNIKNQTTIKFGIGYANKEWDSLTNHFKEENVFTHDELEKGGLLVKSDKDKEKYYDRFRGRLMFPIFNENDKVVGFGGRKLYEDDPGGKYINSPETKIYNKSKILYGLNFAKESIRTQDFVILVEGYMDVIALSQAGITNVVASSGTSLTEEQVKLVSRYSKNVVIIFDADLAGIKAAKRGIEIILEAGLELSVVSLPEGEDPDSLINKKGKEEIQKLLNNKKSIINFISSLYEKENKMSTVDDKTEFIKETISYVSRIPNKIKRAFYIKELSSLYNLYESDLRDELNIAVSKYRKETFPKSSVVIPRKKSLKDIRSGKQPSQEEMDLIEIFIKGDEESISYLENNLETSFIKNILILKITEIFLDEYMNEGRIAVSKVLNNIEDEEVISLITKATLDKHELSVYDKSKNNLIGTPRKNTIDYLKYAKDIIKKFKINELEEEIRVLGKDETKINKIIEIKKQINELSKP